MVVPSDRLDLESAGRLILERLIGAEMRAGETAARQIADFKQAADIQVLLCESGYPVTVEAEKGRVQLTVERPVLFLNRLAKKLEQRVQHFEGVRQVETRPGVEFFQADIYRQARLYS